MGKLGNLDVEARVVNQYNHIRLKGHNIATAVTHLREDGADIESHLHKAEERHLAVVLHQIFASAHLGHHISTPEAELCLGVGLTQATH